MYYAVYLCVKEEVARRDKRERVVIAACSSFVVCVGEVSRSLVLREESCRSRCAPRHRRGKNRRNRSPNGDALPIIRTNEHFIYIISSIMKFHILYAARLTLVRAQLDVPIVTNVTTVSKIRKRRRIRPIFLIRL